MTFVTPRPIEPGPSQADMEAAQEASRALARLVGKGGVRVSTEDGHEPGQGFMLPAPAIQVLMDVLAILADGRSVAIMPDDAALTTQAAADMLNVSRPHLIKLLEEGKLQHHKVGTHRRIMLRHLTEYRQARNIEARAALDELAQQAQDLDMGY